MRKREPFTLIARRIGGHITIYYRYRRNDCTRSSMLSTGIDADSGEPKDIERAKRKARLVCMELMKKDQLAAQPSATLNRYCEDFFSEGRGYVQWRLSKGTEKRRGLAPSTITFYRRILEKQILPYLGDARLSDLNPARIKDWALRLKKKYSNKSINHALGVMHIVCRQAMEEGVLHSDPMMNVGIFRVDKLEIRLFTVQELKELFREQNWEAPTARRAAILSCCTGMRIGEVAAITSEDMGDTYIDVNKSYSPKYGYGDVKTHESRKVPVCAILRDLVALPGGETGSIFKGRFDGKPLTPDNMRWKLRCAMKRAGIDFESRNLTFHAFRHFFNTYLQKENISPAKIRAVIGHKDYTMTGVYTNWDATEFPEVYAAQEKLIRSILWQ